MSLKVSGLVKFEAWYDEQTVDAQVVIADYLRHKFRVKKPQESRRNLKKATIIPNDPWIKGMTS